MNHLRRARKWNIVFRGMVLALTIFLVACGSDSDSPEPTATSGSGQAAVPTVPPVSSTPGTDEGGGEVATATESIPATAEAPSSTADGEDIDDASTPPPSVADLTDDAVATLPVEATDPIAASTPVGEADVESDGTVATPSDGAPVEEAATGDTETGDTSTPEATERPVTGNETFDNPGDGTGGSGMPGERNSNNGNEGDGDAPFATPSASPVAQFSIEGCDVPDVPNFVGETTTFILTADVNFRSGPGVDCDPVIDEPLGEGQTIEVTGGPVIQSADDSEWVEIEIDGNPGWITTEFIEPAE